MKIKILLFSLLSLTIVLPVFAQKAPEENKPEEVVQNIEPEEVPYFKSTAFGGNVVITQPSEIAKLVGTRMAILKKQKGFMGYRVRVYADVGSGARKKAEKIKINFRSNHKGIEPYLIWNSPNWEIHVGDFRTKMEAMHILNQINEEFPEAFIITEVVNFPDLNFDDSVSETEESE